MLEGLAAWILNNYLGKYVENLNTDQLNIIFLSGKIELENLPLKKDALQHFGLPVEIKSGFIGKVKLQIPVPRLRSTPWLIAIEQLYLVASPLPVDEWNAESEEMSAHELKLSALDTYEARWRLEMESKDSNNSTTQYYASSYSSWYNFGSGIVSDIIENLQLKIEDVHIRYEDNVSNPGKPMAFGITMDYLSAETCDANWLPGFSHWAKGDQSFKVLEMHKLAMYWMSLNEDQLLSKLSLAELAIAMSQTSSVDNYILAPVSATAHIKRNRSEQPLRSTDTPRIVCDLLLEEVPLTLVDWQYNQIVKSIHDLSDTDRLRSYRRHKPVHAIHDDPRAWWLYAIKCLYPGDKEPEFCRPRPTWQSCQIKAQQNVRYVEIYKKCLTAPHQLLTDDEKNAKDLIEWQRNFDELKILRDIAMMSVVLPNLVTRSSNEDGSAAAGRSILLRWFPQWMGWYSSSPSSITTDDEAQLLEGEILQVLNESAENNTIFRRDVVFGQVNFCLKRGCLNLCASRADNKDSASMLELEFKNLSLNIVSKPRTSSHLIELSLGSLHLKDKITLNTLFPVLIGPPGLERTIIGRMSQCQSPRVSVASKLEEKGDHLFYVVYEKRPHNSGSDYRLCIKSKSLDIVYQPNAVRWLIEFLCLPYQKNITQSRIEAMKMRTKKGLIKNWEQILDGRIVARTTWELDFDIHAPQIIFVEQFTDNNSAMAVIDFGQFQLNNYSVEKTLTTTETDDDDEMFLTPCSTPPQSEASNNDSDDDPITLEFLPNLEPDSSSNFQHQQQQTINETNLHDQIYDRYSVEMTDLQILIGKVKDNWRHALNKGISTLHVLDRFNITLQLERRIIHTTDPLYPSLTLNANLPKLVAHLNEQKIISARNLFNIITLTGGLNVVSSSSPIETTDYNHHDDDDNDDDTISYDTSLEMSRFLMMQFTIDQMTLEVQSRGRSVAELQVAGVIVGFTKRLNDISITLHVHSLLLADALQTFGPDFELLVASHKHVGMDTMSGSLRDSEPTSPVSPASPEPTIRATSPVALTQALSNLSNITSSAGIATTPRKLSSAIIETEALITIEIFILGGQDPLHIANIQFNTLDIIANQATIVELIGFTQRVFPKTQKPSTTVTTNNSNTKGEPVLASGFNKLSSSSVNHSNESVLLVDDDVVDGNPTTTTKLVSTKLSFDFQRLNVLLLRGILIDGGVLNGKKICTATMSGAKIQANVGEKIEIEGSLGGLQVLDLTPEGHMHQRIVSVGRDLLYETSTQSPSSSSSLNYTTLTVPPPPSAATLLDDEHRKTAFSFRIIRSLDSAKDNKDVADVTLKMASLWYIHSRQFVVELQSCISEFQQYLSNLARSIRTAATDMALGLVHARTEALAQSIYMNARLSSSIYGSALSFSECSTPRKRRRSSSMDTGYKDTTVSQTPYSPADSDDFIIDLKLNIELDSPVLVLPRASNSAKVFVAHLGKINVTNKYDVDEEQMNIDRSSDLLLLAPRIEHYIIEIRDMNLFSLDTSSRRRHAPGVTMLSKPEVLYSCKSFAKPILHDTIIKLHIKREIRNKLLTTSTNNDLNDDILIHDDDNNDDDDDDDNELLLSTENISISGSVVNNLKVSLTRAQYEQLLDTLQWLTSSSSDIDIEPTLKHHHENNTTFYHHHHRTSQQSSSLLTDIDEEDVSGVTTLNMDPHLRAKLFPTLTKSLEQKQQQEINNKKKRVDLKISFELPMFTIELRGDSPSGEQGLVDLSFRELLFNYEKCHLYETSIQVSLRSIFMEDLLQPETAKQRAMVVTSSGYSGSKIIPQTCVVVSHSCPDISTNYYSGQFSGRSSLHCGSLPDHLETARIFGMNYLPKLRNIECPCTPPPSPRNRNNSEKNLVLISTLLVDSNAPNFHSTYNSIQRSTSVDFNCLDLVINVESWIVVIDFFSASPSSPVHATTTTSTSSTAKTTTTNCTSSNVLKQTTNNDDDNESLQQQQPTTNETSETNITIRSLTVVLVRFDRELAKANISNVDFSIKSSRLFKEVDGRLGSMSLQDLTLHGQLYRERFTTSGKQALQFKYVRVDLNDTNNDMLGYDAQLKINMSSVTYVHTKRFVAELQAFFNHFTQLHALMNSIRAATSGQLIRDDAPMKLSLMIQAGSPIILLPVSSKSHDLLVADFGQLTVTNSFQFAGDPGTISVVSPSSSSSDTPKLLLDVMVIELDNMDLYTAFKDQINNCGQQQKSNRFVEYSQNITKCGGSLLKKKFQLKVQVERNLGQNISHNVPDMSIYGQLSTLDGCLDLEQYRLIRGLLAFNLGEDTERILPSVNDNSDSVDFSTTSIRDDIWTLSSIRFDLQNVTLHLQLDKPAEPETTLPPPLTCINFIKSRLTLETFSNLSQDIDLISQEISIIDTRLDGTNVFTNILQPVQQKCTTTVNNSDNDVVQVEIHSRKRQDRFKFTILLNNMRLMAIFDWWEKAQNFIFQDINNDDNNTSTNNSPEHNNCEKLLINNKVQEKTNQQIVTFELKLNITDSEIVLVEDTGQWDSNAVILKSTTVLTYKPTNLDKPSLSCSLNHCEMFSCILGMEDDTALSIIDPITLNMDINRNNILEIQLQFLTVRLSYHDIRMFMKMLNSIPKQMFTNQRKTTSNDDDDIKKKMIIRSKNIQSYVNKLETLGFKTEDCLNALEICNDKLDDAALWLTQNVQSLHQQQQCPNNVVDDGNKPLNITAIEIKAGCISICIIDDCGDSDVPLVEFTLSRLILNQLLPESIVASTKNNEQIYPQGGLECVLTSDYYNRVLSGWEPFIEPWRCKIGWERILSLTSDLQRNRLNLVIESLERLDINITSTLIELYSQVKENWLKDYYNLKQSSNNAYGTTTTTTVGYRRRSPFVAYALKNDTGSPLRFTTLITEINTNKMITKANVDNTWFVVASGETVPFSFKTRDKMRHQDSHKMKMHQLVVKVEGWQDLTPVTVDRVGVYFRNAPIIIQNRAQSEIPSAKIVFDVALEGSARKLVTVRSARLVVNKLPVSIELKLESQLPSDSITQWVASKSMILHSDETLAIPLIHAFSQISIRPTNCPYPFTYCTPPLFWNHQQQQQIITNNISDGGGTAIYELRSCHNHKGQNYRFCAELLREGNLNERNQQALRLTVLPAVKLSNLLPIDLNYNLSGVTGRVLSGSNAAIANVNPEDSLEFEINLENFQTSNKIVIPSGLSTEFTCRLRLEDERNRKLYLSAIISPNKNAKLKIIISAPFWIINKTGLPLIYRQAGTSQECAGQFNEHELARMMTPLLFSFSDHEASPTINVRVGNCIIQDGLAQWSTNFHVHKGVQVKKLHCTYKDGRPDTVFVVGIEVRQGRGKYRQTNIIIISPRYQLYNRSSYKLIFAQSYFTRNLTDPKSQKTCLKAMPNSHMPFHWPRLDQEQLLSVSIQDISDCCWSGGLIIDRINSMHVNVRDSNGRVYFLRLEVILQGATFLIVFTDADTLPPPLRVDNFSEVSITFAQTSCKDYLHSTARAHSSVPYAWDQPIERHSLTITAPGGVSSVYDTNKLGPANGLTYENFIYIAFIGTFKNGQDLRDPLDVDSQELVLDVLKKNHVILARKRYGQRSQLWRMTNEGYLQHEGSSPPLHPNQRRNNNNHTTIDSNVFVLDIESTAPQPNHYSRLMLRRIDARRKSTQTWRFTDDGRLCCAHYNMCVQAQDGFIGLRQGNSVVLGLPQPICHKLTERGVPIEQAISRQLLRPGSGLLSVTILMDGPTRVLSIKDLKGDSNYTMTIDDNDWCNISLKQRPLLGSNSGCLSDNIYNNNNNNSSDDQIPNDELQLTINLVGIGVSLVTGRRNLSEELLYVLLSNIIGELLITSESKRFCISVGDIQIDNQLIDSNVNVVLYVTPPSTRNNDEINHKLPAIDFSMEMLKKVNENAVIFKYLILSLKKITIILEEKLLLKLFDFVGFHSNEEELLNNKNDENDHEIQRLLMEVSAIHAKRYYFGVIKLVPDQIRLSVKTATKLPPHLQRIKRKLGLTLIKFEDAAVDLDAFDRNHPFETGQFLINSIIKHFKDVLMWQAGIILGSVDFLGNPLGFVNDVSEGVSGLIFEGNVGALVKNVTHGLSNSAVKVTESISDGLGRAILDDNHEEIRQKIRQVDSGRSRDHIVAGFKGLGLGFFGGATGLFTQVYAGAAADGLQGIFSGFGKGLVGAVTKPVVGVLDFASETARAVRDSSKSKLVPERIRLPRCVYGPGGLLPRYSKKLSQGQQYLYIVNDKNYKEQLVAYEILGSPSEDLQCIVSNMKVRIVASTNTSDLMPVIDCHLSDLESCNVIIEKESVGTSGDTSSMTRCYIEIVMHVNGGVLVNSDPVKKPRIRCKSQELANRVCEQIKYAKRLYFERFYTLINDNITNIED